jgi:LysM repeat protein
MRKLKVLLIVLLYTSTSLHAQNTETIKKYIDTYKDLAMSEMIRTGVPASITLAQGIHESGAGNSILATDANNHFGIKCKSNWTGESITHDDDKKNECFRKYPSANESFKDHSDFLKSGERYASLFELDPEDYSAWANGLKKAGYATNPKYPQVLIKLIEDYDLEQYSLIALQTMHQNGQSLASNKESVAAPSMVIQASAVDMSIGSEKKAQYPSGQFLINETKVVYVPQGTSWISIAKQYDIDLKKLFDFNEIEQAEATGFDQLVYLQRKRKTGAAEFHEVRSGESLYDISQTEGIRLESLLQLNLLLENERPAIGEKLYLKAKAIAKPRLEVKGNFSLLPARSSK